MQGYLSPTFDADGRPVGVVSYNTDVTAQVRETQVLRATVEQIQEAVSAALNGDLSHRIGSDGQNGQVESLCRAMNALFEAIATVVNDVNRSVDAARNRDLCVRIDMTGKKGVFGELAGGVNTLIDDTVSLLRQIRTAAAEVRSGADEISKGNIHLSQRTETQATNLEETASSMAQMTNSVKATADNAGQARALSVAAREQAEKGGKVVENAIAAMRGINTSSKRIADIIGVIDAIAFQTNLLALNAAVEAARAGDQGRGFAVVASEVRNLAGRSASAAKEIKALIKESVVRVEEGSRLVDESGMALGDIGAAVERVSDVIAEIARASCEQASGIEHVNQAVIEMDEMTQQNAALVEQAAAVSEAILDEATRLAEAVARYRIGEEPSVDPSVNGGRYRD
ncbi:MAG: hypothetical protein KGL34_02590 [Gammaproteobacteria bacterium]|nr:hypothetical protein [Gammaproteobacteria bacterium]